MTGTSSLGSAAVPPLEPDDHVRGSGPLVVAYLDLACPRCAGGWPRMTGLPLPYTVSVVPWNSDPGEQAGRDPQAYARSLAEVVASSRAFRSSRFETSPGGDADLVAMSMGMRCETSVATVARVPPSGTAVPAYAQLRNSYSARPREAR